MSLNPASFAPLFEIAVLMGPPILAVCVARVVRGKDYDLFGETA